MTVSEDTRRKKRDQKNRKRKEATSKGPTPPKASPQQNQDLSVLLKKVQEFTQKFSQSLGVVYKELNGSMSLLLETMYRSGIIKDEDIENTKQARLKREERRKEAIKKLLESDLDTEEKLHHLSDLEKEDVPVYDRLIINPIKDLNLDPYEVFEVLKEDKMSLQEMANLGQKWGIPVETLEKILTGIHQQTKREKAGEEHKEEELQKESSETEKPVEESKEPDTETEEPKSE
jgi:hypothetical protein